MTYYLKQGNTFRPNDEMNMDFRDKLPVGNYVIKEDMFGNLFFEIVDSFTFPSKRYGENPRWTERILSTFLSRASGTGIMLTGEKGSGKSLLAKTISMEGANRGIPTIIINAPWHGDRFNMFIQSIEQPCIILFDEFEKVYNQDQQEGMLTLLDGVFPTQKLFVFTCNDKWRVDKHMRNRPGRIFYVIDFNGLDESFIVEYCEDNLKNKEHIPKICKIAMLFNQFNFDMLKALVEEMNRYDETPTEALEMLNVRMDFDEGTPTFLVKLFRDGKPMLIDREEWRGNPMANVVGMYHRESDETDEDGNYDETEITFSPNNIVQLGPDGFTYTKDGFTLKLNRKPPSPTSWYDAF